jgi:drug/metabolite transporter (DMT)-like permease
MVSYTASRLVLGSICILVNVVTSVAFLFIVQQLGDGTTQQWDKPWFQVTVYHGVWVLMLPVAIGIQHYQQQKHDAPVPIAWRRMALWGFTGGPLLVCSAFLNYLSLSRLSLFANSALSNSVFVLIFAASVVLLREPVTLSKVSNTISCFLIMLLTMTTRKKGWRECCCSGWIGGYWGGSYTRGVITATWYG